jgi:hypothetical protein
MTGRISTLLLLLLALTGCVPPPDPGPPSCGAGTSMPVYSLYFGRSVPNGGTVADRDWDAFRESTITPNLPNGYTFLDAEGAWAAPGTGRTIHERTKMLIVALPPGPAGLAAIERVRSAYRTQFHQQQVGMTIQAACASF